MNVYLNFLHLRMSYLKPWHCSNTAEVFPPLPKEVQGKEEMALTVCLCTPDGIVWPQSMDAWKLVAPLSPYGFQTHPALEPTIFYCPRNSSMTTNVLWIYLQNEDPPFQFYRQILD